ncbi:baseplate wedge protein [Arthrobacter phage Abba]|uniref:Baseplate wedge protein n=1 Tax=Arthrobacter phage Abba TaxID=2713256 RepID=A0A6G8R2D3_9CAUD|nr:baseplate protein [Arthrobacter phage Abba]QIN94359.1 baseplate wedge protein [Arthrobacter phage Abba]
MADGALSFPFEITPTGEVATVGYGTDAEVEQAIAVLVLTEIGERQMSPGFGVPDPAFAGLHVGDIQVGLDDYGPTGITITSVDIIDKTDRQSVADIRWTRDEEGDFQS